MRNRKYVFCILFFFIILVLIWKDESSLLRKNNGKIENIGQLIGIDISQPYEIYIAYQGVEVSLDSVDEDRLKSALEKMRYKGKKKETHGFSPSEYSLILKQDGISSNAVFYWFTGRAALSSKGGTYYYPDRRVDVTVGDECFSFEQDEIAFWNEDLCRSAFDKAVKQLGIDGRYKIDGYDRQKSMGGIDTFDGEGIDGINWSKVSTQELIDNSDYIILVNWKGKKTDSLGFVYNQFEVIECIKGELEEKQFIEVIKGVQSTGVAWDGKSYIYYEPVYFPEYQTEKVYILCLVKTEEVYDVVGGMFGSGVIDEGIVYPRYNTEYHPLYNIPIEEITKMTE